MKHLGLLIILAAPLLFGQMCGTTGPVEQNFGGGLTPGLYAGSFDVTGVLTAYGTNPPPPKTVSDQEETTLTVASSGIPCNTKGQEYRVGLSDSVVVGGATIQQTVTGLTVDNGRVSVFSDVSMVMTFPDGSSTTLTGTWGDLFTQNGSSIEGSSGGILSGTIGSFMVIYDIDMSGTVTR
ncbi:MAG TPA: hypothetical protein PLQ89_20875 [Phycisphaerae bacterium]|nr:hypothetical protein [Phycisphaerae bacterium]